VFGLDELIARLGDAGSLPVVLAVALLLGLRHATDPDHLVAVSTLVATEREHRVRRAARLGLAWGLGHATSLILLGLPFVLVAALLPAGVQHAAELVIGLVIMLLALRLFVRWRRGAFHVHGHRHGPVVHRHLHPHAQPADHDHPHRVRSPLAAYGIGLVHGIGGSAGIAVLLLAGIPQRREALAALALFAGATAVSMALLSSGLGVALGLGPVQRRFARAVPALAALAFAFGGVYSTLALGSVV
jgi:ABC-type nickel/cobalt efflux system permease component RcnA